MRGLFIAILFGSILSASCVPDVYLIDRQTVLELEASGEWKELDQGFQKKELSAGPQALESTSERVEQRQIFSMTHSDREQKPQTKAK